MTAFAIRDATHDAHKADVRRSLEARGFTIIPAGWETLTSREKRAAKQRWPGELGRWWPDLEIRRGPFGRMWVDAKTDQSDSDNYSVELAALTCYGFIESVLRRRVALVWPGGFANWSTDLVPVHVQTRGHTNGSGTAFVLIRKADQRTFNAVFGPVE